MKPYLARGGITCIGATTTQEYQKHIEPDRPWPAVFNLTTLKSRTKRPQWLFCAAQPKGFKSTTA